MPATILVERAMVRVAHMLPPPAETTLIANAENGGVKGCINKADFSRIESAIWMQSSLHAIPLPPRSGVWMDDRGVTLTGLSRSQRSEHRGDRERYNGRDDQRYT